MAPHTRPPVVASPMNSGWSPSVFRDAVCSSTAAPLTYESLQEARDEVRADQATSEPGPIVWWLDE